MGDCLYSSVYLFKNANKGAVVVKSMGLEKYNCRTI